MAAPAVIASRNIRTKGRQRLKEPQGEKEEQVPPAGKSRREGRVDKKVLSTSGGIIWQHRRAVLAETRLFFTHTSERQDVHDYIPLDEITGVDEMKVERMQSVGASFIEHAGEHEGDDSAETHWPCFTIHTIPNGYNAGRTYIHRCPSEGEARAWVMALKTAVKEAAARKKSAEILQAHGHSTVAFIRAHARELEASDPYNYAQGVLILSAFILGEC